MAPRKRKGNGEEMKGADGNSKSRKKMVSCCSTEDIFSNLPCNIIDNILICLPVRDAARTSILSRKWRFKWFSIPQLVFDSDKDEFFRSTPTSPKTIWSRIYQILLLHDGPLHKLVISVDEVVENQSSILNQIILFLTRKGIQEFSLYPPNMRTTETMSLFPPNMCTSYTIPSTLFMCTHLSHLKIIDCMLRLPAEYTGFCKLVSVHLDLVDFTASDFETFLSKCPLLQRLKLEYCWEADHIEIDAPNLKFLYFDCPLMFSFKNVPVLSTLIIKQFSLKPSVPSSFIVKVFGSLPAIEYFYTGSDFLKDLTSSIIPDRLPVMLNQLKFAELCGLDLRYSKDVQFALLVIRSSPNLLKLKIELDDEYKSDVNDVPINLVEDSFDQLREVMIKHFTGTVREWEFIDLLLAKSLVLEKIMIQPSKRIAEKKVIEILKALLQYQSASKQAQLIFLDSAEEVSQMFSYCVDLCG